MSDTNSQQTLDTNVSEVRLNRLEAAWQAWRAGDAVPHWQEYMPAEHEPCTPDFIFALLQRDIGYRIKAGFPALLAQPYFTHPRLLQEDACLDAPRQVKLIRWEYQQRWSQRDRAARAEYEAAFPQHAPALRDLKPCAPCPRCHKILVLDETQQTLFCPDCNSESGWESIAPFVSDGTPPAVLVELDQRRYALAETLGHGGMGEVYRCGDPALGRDLAIKVMKAEHGATSEAERRFLREARITASLQHPAIVPVHNLGRLADGRLHYTMRLVRGRTFAEILKEEGGKAPRLPYLLTIFEKICQAVAYAHSKRVIHRDLKPSNVMVGKFGEVQVMDWGLAKLLNAESATEDEPRLEVGATLIHTEASDTPADLTRAGTVIGTPPYMPPEQAQSDWQLVDERTDVFALGSILCEILTGHPAHRGEDTNEIFRRAKRGDLADALRRLNECGADGNLMNLCLECLSYEREGRPRDAGIVAERVTAYQTEVQERLRQAELERVEAEARAREEQARLEVEEERTRVALARLAAERRTRRRLLTLSGAVLVTIATAFVLVRHSADQANNAKNQALTLATNNEQLAREASDLASKEKTAREIAVRSQQNAELAARKAQAVAKFLGGIFEASDPLGVTSQSIIFPHAAGEKLSGQELLERGANKCERELNGEPELQAAVLTAIGNAYVNLGEYRKGRPLLEKALHLAQQRQDNSQEIATIEHALGSLYHAQGDYDTAEKLYKQALERRETAQPIDELLIADTLFNLGWLLTEKEEHAEAEQCYQRCLALRTRILGKNHRLVALCQVGLSAVYLDQNTKYFQSWSLMSQSIRTFQQVEGSQALSRAMGLFQEGILLLHGSTRVPWMSMVVGDAREQGIRLLQECLQLVKSSPLGKDHIYVAFISGSLALELGRTGEDERARPYFEECLKIIEERVGLWHPKLDNVALAYAALLNRQQKQREADQFFQRVLKAREDRFGKTHPKVANALVGYALIHNKFDPEQEKLCLRARAIYEQAQPLKGMSTTQKYAVCLTQLGAILLDVHHQPAEAEKLLRATWDRFHDSRSVYPPDLGTLGTLLARAMLEQGKEKEAEQWLQTARELCEADKEIAPLPLKENLNLSIYLCLRKRRLAEAVALALDRRKHWPDDPDQLYLAGRTLLECAPLVGQGSSSLTPAQQKERQGYLDQGIALCQQAVERYRKIGNPKNGWYKVCLSWLARALYDTQRYAEAEEVFDEMLILFRMEFGKNHPEIAHALNLRAQIWLAQRKYEGVERNLREAESILTSLTPQQERLFGAAVSNARRLTLELLIQLYTATGRPAADLARLFEEMVRQRQATLGRDAADTLSAQIRLANAYSAAGRREDAIGVLEPTLTGLENRVGATHPEAIIARNNLGVAYWAAGRMHEALPLHQETLKQRRAQLGPDHPDTLLALANLGITYRDMGRVNEAIPVLEEALELARKRSGGFPPQLGGLPGALAETYEKAEQFPKAEAIYRDFLQMSRRQFGPDDPRTSGSMAVLALNLLRQHRYAEAETLLRTCLTIRAARQPEDWATFNARSMLGEALLGQKKHGEAESLLVAGYEGMKQRQDKIPQPFRSLRLAEALDRLIRFYVATQDEKKAKHWRTEFLACPRGTIQHAARARQYADAFAADAKEAEDMEQQPRYHAACNAVLAATMSAHDARLLPDKGGVMFRHWALRWLREELTSYTRLAERNDPATLRQIQQRLTHWRNDLDLISVRAVEALDRLPDNERAAWQALWRDVDKLATRATIANETIEATKQPQP